MTIPFAKIKAFFRCPKARGHLEGYHVDDDSTEVPALAELREVSHSCPVRASYFLLL